MARRRNPFDLFGDFDEMFEEMLKEFENMGPREHMGGPFFYGFSINQRPGEEPEIREFGEHPPRVRQGRDRRAQALSGRVRHR